MCGRYYVDFQVAEEVGKLAPDWERKLIAGAKKDIHPSEEALVLTGQGGEAVVGTMRWGFPGYQGKGLIINARAEGVLDKPFFRDSILHRRCVIPAKGFYEWNKAKEKSTFYRKKSPVIWMAGCYKEYHGENRFVILTTDANVSVAAIHDRMPLILEQQEAEAWLLDDQAVEFLLHKIPPLLEREQEYEQMTLF
ncbi:MAG: SOS response-associated peptidase [Eubacteriales bacterium]|nr:SOS response-associated peptidase [Eubacteriales bacterium]